ncbi:Multidrug transporter [Candidatus Filomicrobium marinum]|uniref:Multidrug transporter n=2 Tax=Filomicrobium TaxID=119044 RepID=A0A0D6JKD0_9HYPH|nr:MULTISPECIES: pitrilysin family protein [Filomicrobium]MCV0369148.1 insulinase family protein [Filomicrobium sp.]CFX60505.1 Multidrug transporter [Candidatus Filomicrobium marinum]CPR22418.1 Multidrug transporter [Candidatus Filomicrobium marinum]SDO85373.1 Predicted Zn-dependent peptidase [Filomicrobium insigne]
MTTRITELANGLRVVTHQMDHLETLSLGVWVNTGARHEPETLHGISHLLEHMAFKGTTSRTAQRIAEEIEEVGGEINAATSIETTAYYARVLKGDDGTALEILADILQDSLFDPMELDRERDVILQEIAASQDSPDDLVYDLVQDAAYPEQPIGRTILGTPESVQAITSRDLRSYLDRHYAANRLVVSAAGAVDHDSLCRQAEALFDDGSAPSGDPTSGAVYAGGVRSSKKAFEQSHIVIGFEGPAYRAEDFFAVQVLSGLLGGGMSSRLFQEVREKRGLCYAIYSSAWGLSDTGLLAVHAATGPEQMQELVDVVSEELSRLAQDGPTDAEMGRAKAQLKAGLMMGLESSSARAEQMARHLMAHGRLIEKEELIAKVEEVSPTQVKELMQRMIAKQPAAAVVGAGASSRGHAQRASHCLGTIRQ